MNNKLHGIIILALIVITIIAMHGCHETENTKREAIKAGLMQQRNNFGSPIWVHKNEPTEFTQ